MGTSFASPIVAGGVARYLQNHPNAGWVEIMNYFAAEAAANNNLFVLDPRSK